MQVGKGRGRVEADSKDHVHARQAVCHCQTCGTGLKFCPRSGRGSLSSCFAGEGRGHRVAGGRNDGRGRFLVFNVMF